MSTVTEVQETSGAITYGGSWGTISNAATSGGSCKSSPSGSGTVTYTFSGRSLYLVTAANQSGGAFTVTIDGASVGGVFSCESAGGGLQNAFRVVMPLARGLTDGSHTVVLTVTAGTVYVDSFLVVTGTRSAAGTGNLVCLGDSWTLGTGATSTGLLGFAARLCTQLSGALQRAVTLTNKGTSGDCYVSTASGTPGGMYRLFSDVVPASPEFLTILFGANDLRATTGVSTGQNIGAADLGRYVQYALCFVEDVWDTTGALGVPVRVAVGTPGYVSGAAMVGVPATTGLCADSLELAQSVVRAVVAQFPWCRLADVWAAMDRRDNLVYPNTNSDLGLHPNDIGHGVLAATFARALLS